MYKTNPAQVRRHVPTYPYLSCILQHITQEVQMTFYIRAVVIDTTRAPTDFRQQHLLRLQHYGTPEATNQEKERLSNSLAEHAIVHL